MSKLDTLTDAAIVEALYRAMQIGRLLEPLETASTDLPNVNLLAKAIRHELNHLREALGTP